jgi:hypothetical protein
VSLCNADPGPVHMGSKAPRYASVANKSRKAPSHAGIALLRRSHCEWATPRANDTEYGARPARITGYPYAAVGMIIGRPGRMMNMVILRSVRMVGLTFKGAMVVVWW